jgi:hypothetical protein
VFNCNPIFSFVFFFVKDSHVDTGYMEPWELLGIRDNDLFVGMALGNDV